MLVGSVLLLAAGVVHGDLSEYNILLGADGPVIIDLGLAASTNIIISSDHGFSTISKESRTTVA